MDKENTCGIYQIRNLVNGKVYIGSSNNTGVREKRHKKDLNTEKHFNPHLQSSWNKYGGDNFLFEVVECVLEKNLFKAEQSYLDNTIRWGFDYNVSRLADKPPSGYGEENPYSKLTEKDVLEIFRLYSSEIFSQGKIAEMFRVNQATVSGIVRGKSWRYLYDSLPKITRDKLNINRVVKKFKGIGSVREGELCPTSKLKEPDVLEIRSLFKKDPKKYTQVVLGKMFNVSRATIGKVIRRETWKHI